MKRSTRPNYEGNLITTPKAGLMFQLLGAGLRTGDVRFTHDEETALNKLYGFKKEKPNKKPPKPTLKKVEVKPGMDQYAIRRAEEQAEKDHVEAVKRWEKWEDPIACMQAGADRNMVRHAESDGIRLIAWLAKYVTEGEDPLKTLVQLAVDAGWDVDPSDVTWADAEVSDDEEAAAEE